jgi:hypothetical protein
VRCWRAGFNTNYRVRTVGPFADVVVRLAPLRQDVLYRRERTLVRSEVAASWTCSTRT